MASWDDWRQRVLVQDAVQDGGRRVPRSVVMHSPPVERTGGACLVVRWERLRGEKSRRGLRSSLQAKTRQ